MGYAEFYRRSHRGPRRLLGRAGAADRLAAAAPDDLRLQPSALHPLVRRRHHQPLPQRRRPAPEGPRRPAGADLRLHRDRRRAHLQLPRAAWRGAARRRRAQGLGVQQGRPGADLHADDRARRRSRCWPARASARSIRVVFGGFASVSLASRIEDATPKVIVSADAGSRGGKVVAYKPLLDEAIRLSSHKPESVLLVDRGLAPMERVAGRDHDWADARRQRHSGAAGANANGWIPPTSATPSTPAAPPAGPRACSATSAATPWRWRPA